MASFLKDSALAVSEAFHVNSLFRRVHRRKLIVLAYHGVTPDGDLEEHHSAFCVGRSLFCEQLDIVRRFLNPVSARDVLEWATGDAPLPESPVLVTFDDGYRNNLVHAVPELERRGIPAVFHVTAGWIGTDRVPWPQRLVEQIAHWPLPSLPTPGRGAELRMPAARTARVALAQRMRSVCKALPDESRRQYLETLDSERPFDVAEKYQDLFRMLSWDEVRLMHRRGFAIGSHTMEHPILTKLSSAALDRELRLSKTTIERELGAECSCIAYPNGGAEDVSSHVIARCQEAGYKVGFTLMDRLNTARACPFELDRIGVSGNHPRRLFHAQISGLYDLLKGYRSVSGPRFTDCTLCASNGACRRHCRRGSYREQAGSHATPAM